MHHQQQPGASELRNRREVVDRVIGKAGTQRAIDRVLVIREKERVAVGRRLSGQLARDHARGAGAVLDDHLLLHQLAELGAEEPCQEIGRAARRRRHVDADWMIRIVLRRHAGGDKGKAKAPQISHGWERTTR